MQLHGGGIFLVFKILLDNCQRDLHSAENTFATSLNIEIE